jgi:hypothetical protein
VVRRTLLVAGAGALLSGCGSAASGDAGQPAGAAGRAGDIEVLSGLLQLERQSVALYAKQHGPLFRRLEAHEREHAARLEQELKKRGAPAPGGGIILTGAPLEIARRVEETSVAAYLDALPKIADGQLRGVLATIVAAEASHLAEVRRAQGLVPADQPFVTGRHRL